MSVIEAKTFCAGVGDTTAPGEAAGFVAVALGDAGAELLGSELLGAELPGAELLGAELLDAEEEARGGAGALALDTLTHETHTDAQAIPTTTPKALALMDRF